MHAPVRAPSPLGSPSSEKLIGTENVFLSGPHFGAAVEQALASAEEWEAPLLLPFRFFLPYIASEMSPEFTRIRGMIGAICRDTSGSEWL